MQVITSSAERAPCGSSTSPETFATIASVPLEALATLACVHSPAIASLHTENVSVATTKANPLMAFPKRSCGVDRRATPTAVHHLRGDIPFAVVPIALEAGSAMHTA